VRVTACGLQNAIQATKMGCSIEALSNWRLRSRSTQNAVVADHTTAGNCSNRGSPPCTLVFINGWQMSSGQIAVLQAAGGVLSIPPDLLRDNCPISDSVKGYQTPALGTRRTVRAGPASDNP